MGSIPLRCRHSPSFPRKRICACLVHVSGVAVNPLGPHSWGMEKRGIGGHPQTLGKGASPLCTPHTLSFPRRRESRCLVSLSRIAVNPLIPVLRQGAWQCAPTRTPSIPLCQRGTPGSCWNMGDIPKPSASPSVGAHRDVPVVGRMGVEGAIRASTRVSL
jgi:hypothetical protein